MFWVPIPSEKNRNVLYNVGVIPFLGHTWIRRASKVLKSVQLVSIVRLPNIMFSSCNGRSNDCLPNMFHHCLFVVLGCPSYLVSR